MTEQDGLTATTPPDAAPRPSAARNPVPRPALRFEGDEHSVVAARPLPGQVRPREEERRKSKTEKGGDKGSKRAKPDKERRRRKADRKRPKDAAGSGSATRVSDDRTLAVALPQEFRRALERAAAQHGLTPEGLAAFVLVEWLDR